MATTFLDWTEPAAATADRITAREPDRASSRSDINRDLNVQRGDILAELGAIPSARRRLSAVASGVQNGSLPARAVIDGAGDVARINQVLRALDRVQQLDRQMAVLRVRALGRRSAAETSLCRHENAAIGRTASAILRELPIARSFVRALVAELLTLDDQLERASRGLRGFSDIDRTYAIERRVGLRADSFREKCARLRHAEARLAALEHRLIETSPDTSSGRTRYAYQGVLSVDDLARVADRAHHSGVDREFVHTFAEICRPWPAMQPASPVTGGIRK